MIMAKKYKQLDGDLTVPASYGEGLIRSRPFSRRNFLFTPGGGACHCGCSSLCEYTCDEYQYPGYTGPVSEDYLIEIEDVVSKSPVDCTDCDDLNDGFVAEWVGTFTWPYDTDYDYCLWQHEFENPICNFTHVSLVVFHIDMYEYGPCIFLTNNVSFISATLRFFYSGGLLAITDWDDIDRDCGHFFADYNNSHGWNVGTPTCSFNTWLGAQSFVYLTSQ